MANTFDTSLSSCERKKAALEEELKQKNKTIEDYVQQLNDNASHIAELELKTQHLSECEQKLAELSKLQDDLKAVMNELKKVTEKRDSDKAEFEVKSLSSHSLLYHTFKYNIIFNFLFCPNHNFTANLPD